MVKILKLGRTNSICYPVEKALIEEHSLSLELPRPNC